MLKEDQVQVLTSRVGQLLAQGWLPEDIVAITFTRKARDEMKMRLKGLVGVVAHDVRISTFHSIGYAILRGCVPPWHVPCMSDTCAPIGRRP